MLFRLALTAVLAFSHVPPPAETDPAKPAPQVEFQTIDGTVTVQLEIANTMESRTRGLMYRKTLAPNRGMVFVFPREENHHFWMKNTYLPLDLIFVNAKGAIVGIVENAEPGSLVSRSVEKPSLYVIEVNGGFCRRHRVQRQSQITFRGVPTEIPK